MLDSRYSSKEPLHPPPPAYFFILPWVHNSHTSWYVLMTTFEKKLYMYISFLSNSLLNTTWIFFSYQRSCHLLQMVKPFIQWRWKKSKTKMGMLDYGSMLKATHKTFTLYMPNTVSLLIHHTFILRNQNKTTAQEKSVLGLLSRVYGMLFMYNELEAGLVNSAHKDISAVW